jgi:titin
MFEKEKQRPPKFKKPLVSQLNLVETQPAHFETFLVPIGDPDMQIEWYKNGELLRAGHRFKPVHDFGHVALDILYTYPEDDGIYMCKAINKYGTDMVNAELRCKGM